MPCRSSGSYTISKNGLEPHEQDKRCTADEQLHFASKETRRRLCKSYFDFLTAFCYSKRQEKADRHRPRARSKGNPGLIDGHRRKTAAPLLNSIDAANSFPSSHTATRCASAFQIKGRKFWGDSTQDEVSSGTKHVPVYRAQFVTAEPATECPFRWGPACISLGFGPSPTSGPASIFQEKWSTPLARLPAVFPSLSRRARTGLERGSRPRANANFDEHAPVSTHRLCNSQARPSSSGPSSHGGCFE